MPDDSNLLRSATDLIGMLAARDMTVSAAESCTGGLLLSTLTDVSGSSAVVEGGVVSYSNAAKQHLLDVPEALLYEHGAVSQPVAAAMARGIRQRMGTTLGISVTGIAGPGGGSAQKPVGLVYIGLASDAGVQVERCIWHGDRIDNKRASVRAALAMVHALLR